MNKNQASKSTYQKWISRWRGERWGKQSFVSERRGSGSCIKEFGTKEDALSSPFGHRCHPLFRERNQTWSRHNLLPRYFSQFLCVLPRTFSPRSGESVINERRRCCFGLLRSIVHLIAHPVTLTASRGLAWGSLGTTAHKSKVRGFPEG